MEKTYIQAGNELHVRIPNAPEHLIMEDTSGSWLKLLGKIVRAKTVPANTELPMLYVELLERLEDAKSKALYDKICQKNGPLTNERIRLPNGQYGMVFIFPPEKKNDCHEALPNILYRTYPHMLHIYTASIQWGVAVE